MMAVKVKMMNASTNSCMNREPAKLIDQGISDVCFFENKHTNRLKVRKDSET